MNPDVTGPEERRAESSTAGRPRARRVSTPCRAIKALHVTCAVTPAQVA